MKTWSILLLSLFLGACATPPTMEELEAQAWQTGDWSAVERREDFLARRAARQARNTGPMCPDGTIEFCEQRAGDRSCACVSRRALKDAFGWD
jgi:hypothetical protein